MMMGHLQSSRAAAVTLPTVTYVSQVAGAGTGSTTITGTLNIGSAFATRRVFVVLWGAGGAGAAPTGGTIGGQTIDQFTQHGLTTTSTDVVEFLSAVVPTGTTGVALSITFNAAAFGSAQIAVYTADNALMSSPTPITTPFDENTGGAGTNTTTINTTTKAGGFIIAGAWVGGGAGPTITGTPTETYTTDNSFSAYFSAHANGISGTASNTLSTQGPPAGGSSMLAMAAYR